MPRSRLFHPLWLKEEPEVEWRNNLLFFFWGVSRRLITLQAVVRKKQVWVANKTCGKAEVASSCSIHCSSCGTERLQSRKGTQRRNSTRLDLQQQCSCSSRYALPYKATLQLMVPVLENSPGFANKSCCWPIPNTACRRTLPHLLAQSSWIG